jgi:hypothetical protein
MTHPVHPDEPEFRPARLLPGAPDISGLAAALWVRAGSLEGRSASPVGIYEVPDGMPPFAVPARFLAYA